MGGFAHEDADCHNAVAVAPGDGTDDAGPDDDLRKEGHGGHGCAREWQPRREPEFRASPPKGALLPTPESRSGAIPPKTAATTGVAKTDPKVVLANNEAAPELTPLEDLNGPKIPLPSSPIEPFLLQKVHGPFMVLAHTFRGPDATRYAQASASS